MAHISVHMTVYGCFSALLLDFFNVVNCDIVCEFYTKRKCRKHNTLNTSALKSKTNIPQVAKGNAVFSLFDLNYKENKY